MLETSFSVLHDAEFLEELSNHKIIDVTLLLMELLMKTNGAAIDSYLGPLFFRQFFSFLHTLPLSKPNEINKRHA